MLLAMIQQSENIAAMPSTKVTSAASGEQHAGAPDEQPTVTTLLLIRHGENDWVSTNRLAGRTPGVRLNEKGQSQATELVLFLANQSIRAIYSSPLERCIETAQPLAAALERPICQHEGLVEVDYGEWRGAELKELAKRPEWRLVQHYPSAFRFPGGETLFEVQMRAVQTLEQIRRQHEGEVVAIFSHGDVIRLAMAHYLGIAIDLFQRVQVSTASLSVVRFHNATPSVLGLNFVASLPSFETKSAAKST
jgi:probable phosphoglycerate mutase